MRNTSFNNLKSNLVTGFMYILFGSVFVLMIYVGFTFATNSNFAAKALGGTMEVDLPENHTVMNATWKDGASLWVLSKDTLTNEVVFKEYSAYGVLEGKVEFK